MKRANPRRGSEPADRGAGPSARRPSSAWNSPTRWRTVHRPAGPADGRDAATFRSAGSDRIWAGGWDAPLWFSSLRCASRRRRFCVLSLTATSYSSILAL